MKLTDINIFEFSNYRDFLKDYFKEMKRVNSKFSQRYVIHKMGESSAGWVSDILAGRKNLNEHQLFKLCQILDLEPRQEMFFELLVKFEQGQTDEERQRIYQKLRTFQEVPAELLDSDRFEYFANWYHCAIRELLLIKDFKGSTQKIAAALNPAIDSVQAEKSIELLTKLKMIKKRPGGGYMAETPHVKKKSSFNSLHYQNYLKTNITLMQGSMERFTNEVRDVSAITTVLTHDQFVEIREDIKSIRKKMVRLSEEATDQILREGHQKFYIYQGVYGLFPLSQAGEEIL